MAPLTESLHVYFDGVCQTKEWEKKVFITLSVIWDFYNSDVNFR